MVYVDTNVLIYISADQGEEKRNTAAKLVRKLIENNELFLSPLTIQEFIFTLAKLKIDLNHISRDVDFYLDYVQQSIDKDILTDAYALCKRLNQCKNINDVIHLKLAERYCRKLITFDNDFKVFQNKTKIKIEIL
ncbi:MAG: PIN domain-containing protein [Candidatus Aminicenantes bacterium]|jgi:predicted nucleic acid-binding protein|nr:PIN domain-containing protein [Candidatus Aminicenantes bacterium]